MQRVHKHYARTSRCKIDHCSAIVIVVNVAGLCSLNHRFLSSLSSSSCITVVPPSSLIAMGNNALYIKQPNEWNTR